MGYKELRDILELGDMSQFLEFPTVFVVPVFSLVSIPCRALSKSDRAKTRVTHLLKRLLAYANHELEDHQVLEQTTMRWLDRQTAAPKLVVQTTLEDLATLIAPELPSDRLTEHLRHDLRLFKETLHILEDNRTRTQGSKTGTSPLSYGIRPLTKIWLR